VGIHADLLENTRLCVERRNTSQSNCLGIYFNLNSCDSNEEWTSFKGGYEEIMEIEKGLLVFIRGISNNFSQLVRVHMGG